MPRATRLYQSLWLGDGGAPGDRRLAELLQRGATAPGPGLPNAARGVRWRSLRACGQRLHGGWLRRCRQARRHGRKRSVDLCRIRLILHQYLLPRIGRDIGNAAGLSLKSPRFLSSRWGPPQFAWAFFLSEWAIRLVMLTVVPFRRSPAAAQGWLLLIFFEPWIGLVLYGFVGRPTMSRWRVQQMAKLPQAMAKIRERVLNHLTMQQLVRPEDWTGYLAQKLGRMPSLGGNDAEILVDYTATLARLVAEI